MDQTAWIRFAQGLVMAGGAVGIAITEDEATAVVAGVFGVLSILSAVKTWIRKKKNGS